MGAKQINQTDAAVDFRDTEYFHLSEKSAVSKKLHFHDLTLPHLPLHQHNINCFDRGQVDQVSGSTSTGQSLQPR